MANEPKVLHFDPSRCTACRYCEVACSFVHFGEIVLAKSNVRIVFDDETGARDAIHCLHCDAALCLEACPSGAITRDETTKLVKLNPLMCIGCGSCAAACPLGAPWLHEKEGIARKCDFCDGDPKCAKYCSPGAMKIVARDEWKRMEKEGGASD
jgi:Fe-S-cluster-containing hydrogenase component 2